MSADQIEEFIENDIIGHRKTKKMGTYSVDYAEKVEKIMDSLNSSYLGIDKNNLNPNLYSSKYLNALAVLGIDNKNASMIRALLLSAIRSYILWQQSGGTKFRIFLFKKKIAEIALTV